MNVAGFYSPVIVELSGLKASRDRIPIFLDHDPSRIVGQTDSVTIDSSGVRMTGAILGGGADAAKVVELARDGFEWQASIGADIVRQEFLKGGEKAVVNGREVAGPLLIARESRLKETSFVAIGADGQTTANVAASDSLGTLSKGASAMNFDQWLAAKGFDPTALTDTQRTSLKAAFDLESAPPKPAPVPIPTPAPQTQTLDEIFASQRKEDARVAEITVLTKRAISERPAMCDNIERIARLAVEAKSTPAEYELTLLRELRAGATFGINVRGTDTKTSRKVIEAALCMSGRLSGIEKHYDERTLDAASDRHPTGLGLQDLLLLAAKENGYTGTSRHDVRGILQAAFLKADGFSTLSLPGILSNVANKFLVQGFNAVETGWRDIASIRSVNDFKATTSYALTGGFLYEKVGPAGELKHATASETSYTNQAATYGRMFAITRQDIINDDLGALTSVPMKLGRGAALKLNDVFWTEFLASRDTFWASGHANVITGTTSGSTSVLSSEGLKTATQKFRKQTDPDGLPLGIMPAILLVPPELEITAEELMASVAVNTGGSSTVAQVPNANVWRSKYRVVMSTYISNSSYTGYLATQWFLLANPMDLSTIEVAFLNGRETPVVETADADFDTLGVAMRGYHDFGVTKQEYRASVRAAGA